MSDTTSLATVTTPEPATAIPSRREPRGPNEPLLSSPRRVVPFVVAVIALAFIAFPLGPTAMLAAFVGIVLVVVSAIDLEWRIIPNRIVLPATLIVLAMRVVLTPSHALEYVLGGLLAAIALFLPRLANSKAMGMGDVKLALLMGVTLGSRVGWALALGFAFVFPVAALMIVRDGAAARNASIPLSPFLALGALVILLGPGLTGN